MYPNRNPYGSMTFMAGQGSYRHTRSQHGAPDQRAFQSGPSDRSPTSARTTTIIRPGEPHYGGARLDRNAGKLVSNLCRCQNPMGHGDAFAYHATRYAPDRRGVMNSWMEMSNRALSHCGKTQISREEEAEANRHIMHPEAYRRYMVRYNHINRRVARGEPVFVCADQEALQFHNADGHVQNNVTEGGLRTVFNRPEGSGRGSYGGHRYYRG
jgi:hypothetical protein